MGVREMARAGEWGAQEEAEVAKVESEAEPETERFVFCQRSLSGDSAGKQIEQAVQVAQHERKHHVNKVCYAGLGLWLLL